VSDRIVTNRGDFHADWVVAAAGAWTPQIFHSLDLAVPIVPARGQVVLTEACDRMTDFSLSFLSHVYLKQTGNGNFYLGSHTEFVGFDNRITLEKITAYTEAPVGALPILGSLRAIRFFTGFRPISEDELPIIGSVPDCPELVLASGHGPTGMRYSASTGKAVNELIVDGTTELPLEAFQSQ
jgi:glycine/D-amino acid oxidase-like deaminating enzyme